MSAVKRCPHCGRDSKTVQGVCADCWGSKGGRQFWGRKTDQGWPLKLSPTVVGALFIISLEFLNGREKLAGYDVHSLIQF